LSEESLTSLSKLKSLSKKDLEILEQNGIRTVEALLYRSDELEEIFEFYDETLRYRKALDVSIEALTLKKMWMVSAAEWAEVEAKQLKFTTGSKALDDILGGGIHSMFLAEFYGEYGTGKSQILNTIMVEALAKYKDKTAVYIDCEKTYMDFRIRQIAKARGYDPDEIVNRIILIKPAHSKDLLEIVKRLYLTVESRKTVIIVCDSLISHLRAEFLGREMLQPRQHMLARIIHRLKNLAELYNIGIVTSNQVVAVPQATITPFGDVKPVGGHILGHIVEPRVFVRKAGGSKRVARIEDSCWLPPREAEFMITEKGVEDVA